MQIFHNSQDLKYRSPFGAMPAGSEVTLGLDVKETTASAVYLRVWLDEAETIYPMETDKTGEFYTCTLTLPDNPCLLWYYFIIDTDGCRTIYANNRERLGGIGICTDEASAESYQITIYDKNFTTPEWFRGRMMYQIFPDRFFGEHSCGKIPKKREEYIIHYDSNEPIAFNLHPYENGPACNDFYGGNLKGIIAKLPYIKSLGVGVIYLNPIFDAYSNHKYDTANYKEIDPMFGTEEDFKLLCEKASELDIRIILDGVFSHTGADSIYFNKYGCYEGGAYNDESSPYRSWYSFGKNKSYDSWWGCSNLPNVNELTPSYLDYILRDEDSVIKKWLRLGASGWRLDVADELPDEFIEILRTEAKKVNPDAVILGEVWEDASNKVAYSKQRKYLLGGELDSVMNYPFKDNVTSYLMGWIGAEDMNKHFMSIAENYPTEVLYSLMNLIGTHDTMRIKSFFGGLGSDCGTQKLTSGMECLATYRLKCAMFIQMTFIGVPSVYYGDEIGMQGGKDPYNRTFFTWRNIDPELLSWCQCLGNLRNNTQVLKTGLFKPLYANGDVFVYARYFKDKRDAFGKCGDGGFALCAINRGFEMQNVIVDISEFEHGSLYLGLENPVSIVPVGGKLDLNIPPVGTMYIYG